MESSLALLVATSGNILGITLNFWFGYWLYEKSHLKLNSSRIGRKSLYLGSKYSYLALILSWLPVVGDPLTLVAGVLRLNFFFFIFIAGFLRFLRYFILTFVL